MTKTTKKPIRKQSPRKIFLLSGIGLFIIWLPLLTFSDSIARFFLYDEYLRVGSVIRTPIFMILLLVPPILGLILILISVSRNVK